MTAYEKELLALSVEASDKLTIELKDGGCYVDAVKGKSRPGWFGDTLAETLTALLRDLGVEVPERPSAERVADVTAMLAEVANEARGDLGVVLRKLYAREPLTVLALLEGGES